MYITDRLTLESQNTFFENNKNTTRNISRNHKTNSSSHFQRKDKIIFVCKIQ